jgi:hypothetical protein
MIEYKSATRNDIVEPSVKKWGAGTDIAEWLVKDKGLVPTFSNDRLKNEPALAIYRVIFHFPTIDAQPSPVWAVTCHLGWRSAVGWHLRGDIVQKIHPPTHQKKLIKICWVVVILSMKSYRHSETFVGCDLLTVWKVGMSINVFRPHTFPSQVYQNKKRDGF